MTEIHDDDDDEVQSSRHPYRQIIR